MEEIILDPEEIVVDQEEIVDDVEEESLMSLISKLVRENLDFAAPAAAGAIGGAILGYLLAQLFMDMIVKKMLDKQKRRIQRTGILTESDKKDLRMLARYGVMPSEVDYIDSFKGTNIYKQLGLGKLVKLRDKDREVWKKNMEERNWLKRKLDPMGYFVRRENPMPFD